MLEELNTIESEFNKLTALNALKYGTLGDGVGNAINSVEDTIRGALGNMRDQINSTLKRICPTAA